MFLFSLTFWSFQLFILITSYVCFNELILPLNGIVVIVLSLSQFFWLLLDIVLHLCEKEHVEGGMIFQLLEDLTEMSTMRNCKDIFAYIESKQDILGKVCSDVIVGWWNSLVHVIHAWPWCILLKSVFPLHTARALCTWKACDAEDVQSTSSSSVKGCFNIP